jgi:outer membrane biosynthesis protein TonB
MADSEGVLAPAVPADEPPPETAWRIGGLSLASGLVISAIFHFVLVGGVLVVSAGLLQSEPAPAMNVDLITPEELAAMTQKAAEPDKPNPETNPETKPELKFETKPELKLETKPATAEAAQPPAEPPKSQAPATAVASAADTFAMPFLPKPPPPATPTPSVPALSQAAQLATLVGAPSVADLNGGGVSEFKANLTSDEITAFAARVQSCWSAPASLAKEPKLYVILRVSLRRDGSLATDPALQAGAASTLGPALFESAKRALHKCAPYAGLPAEKYDEWRLIDLRFIATGVATAGSVANGPRTPGAG